MPIYVIPHMQQDGKNCWWWAIKMIKHYHRNLADKSEIDIALKRMNLVFKSPEGGLSSDEIEKLKDYNFSPVPLSMFGPEKCSATDLETTLQQLGPLFCGVFTNQFSWKSNHALVISGAGYDPDKQESIFWFNDPASETGPNPWPLDFLLMLTKFIDLKTGEKVIPRVTPLWYYSGARLQIHPGEA
ncbi:papain-like cysteine protease family protein [Uliginosibacterium sp. H3]|uniref:Papain-like cysteine protease family protein n=1 Tax=Uliginosibacterium silvisoli TaxID=3114758 RepID=A0ABU6JZ74_9RHOO|nr:papain-like cysteine protease family protein [Uliginosibacterium sp. H3]